MKKYIVMARKWDDEKQEIVDYIAGEFFYSTHAVLFKSAYDDLYKTSATIEEVQI